MENKCEECGSIVSKKESIKIVSKYGSSKVLFQSTKTTIKEAVVEAVSKCANLKCADLKGADLKGADLKGADLEGADLEGADLKGANLECANLECADLKGANLECANLECADLEGAETRMCKVNFTSKEYKQAKQFIEGLKL